MAEFALYLENADGVIDGDEHRQMTTNVLAGRSNYYAADSSQAFGGTKPIPGAGNMVTQRAAGANMSVDVNAGQVGIQSTGVVRDGMYLWTNTAAENISISAADPTNPRIDVVGVRITDTQYGDLADTGAPFVVTGTPAGSPTVPVLPDNFTPLAQVAVAAAAVTITNANLTHYSYGQGEAHAPGGRKNISTNASGVAKTFPTNLPGGQIVSDNTSGFGFNYYYNGSAYIPLSFPTRLLSYTPVLSTTGTQPVLGTGSIQEGRYRFISNNLVQFWVDIKYGSSGVTIGTGSYRISLPVTPANPIANLMGVRGHINDASATDLDPVVGAFTGSQMYLNVWDPSGTTDNAVTVTNPFTFAINDQFQVSGIYEV